MHLGHENLIEYRVDKYEYTYWLMYCSQYQNTYIQNCA